MVMTAREAAWTALQRWRKNGAWSDAALHAILQNAQLEPRDAALAAAEECIRHGKIVEVNTGAISSSYRTTPYPAPFILKYLREKNAPITLTSDCHAKENIEVAFDETLEMLREIGFRELYVLTGDGFRAEGISG